GGLNGWTMGTHLPASGWEKPAELPLPPQAQNRPAAGNGTVLALHDSSQAAFRDDSESDDADVWLYVFDNDGDGCGQRFEKIPPFRGGTTVTLARGPRRS
ncbi:MAG: hypothetical protein JXR77_15000, partial [Lentisphaeria bacterium]|nr:hypothetical protein [Lentisphaeria bacterium]